VPPPHPAGVVYFGAVHSVLIVMVVVPPEITVVIVCVHLPGAVPPSANVPSIAIPMSMRVSTIPSP
jgi:hypothetical protein